MTTPSEDTEYLGDEVLGEEEPSRDEEPRLEHVDEHAGVGDEDPWKVDSAAAEEPAAERRIVEESDDELDAVARAAQEAFAARLAGARPKPQTVDESIVDEREKAEIESTIYQLRSAA